MSNITKVVVTVARLQIREINGHPILVLQDTDGVVYQKWDCFRFTTSKIMGEEGETIFLLQPLDVVEMKVEVQKHGALDLETVRHIRGIKRVMPDNKEEQK